MTSRLPTRPSGADAALAGLAQEAWDAEMASQPVFATSLGDRRFDDRLRPNGPDAIATDVAMASSLIARAEAIDPAGLAAGDVVTRAALIDLSLELDLVAAGLEAWAVDPLDGPQVGFLNIPSFQPVHDDAERRRLLGRWRDGAVDQPTRRRLREAMAAVSSRPDPRPERRRRARRPPRPPGRGLAAAGARPGPPRDLSPAYGRCASARPPPGRRRRDPSGVRPLPGVPRRRAAPRGEAGRPAGTRLRPRRRRGLPPGSSGRTRHSTCPGGIHDGPRESSGSTASWGRWAIGCSAGDRARWSRGSDRFRDALLHRRRSTPLPGRRSPGPTRPSRLVRPPPEGAMRRRRDAGPREPSLDDRLLPPAGRGRGRPGTTINTSLPETRPRYEAERLAFHEAVPGHHLQIAIAQELEGLPAFRRLPGAMAFVEGWGLYSERMSAEMGLLSGELDRFGILSWTPGGRPGSSSTPGSTQWAGPATRRSRSWSTTRPSPRTTSSTRSTGTWPARPGAGLQDRPARAAPPARPRPGPPRVRVRHPGLPRRRPGPGRPRAADSRRGRRGLDRELDRPAGLTGEPARAGAVPISGRCRAPGRAGAWPSTRGRSAGSTGTGP